MADSLRREERLKSDLKNFVEKNGPGTERDVIEQLKREANRHSERDSERSPTALPKAKDSTVTPIPFRDGHEDDLKGLYRELEDLLRSSKGGVKTFRRRRLSKKKRSRRCTKSKARKSKARKL
jgi:hypothetical protein